jgi:hypothetical protein
MSVLAPYLVIGVGALAASTDAVNGDVDRCADLAHALIAETAQSLGECSDRDALDRVEIHYRRSGDGIFGRLEDDFTG